MKRSIWLAVAVLVALAGCAKRKRASVAPAPVRVGWMEEGIASWYGHPYHGRRASNGEIYDMEKMTAAHRTLPFGAVVRVRNLGNDRAVEVRITDRGPFVNGRIIDLSRAAARDIRMVGPGTAKVRIQVIALPEQIPGGWFGVQIGAFRERDNAERARKDMERRYGAARILLRDGNPPFWRVVVGRTPTLEEAGALAERLRAEVGAAFVVRVDASETDL